MITLEDVVSIVEAAARNFAAMLKYSRLAVGTNAFPERNLSFQFGHAFLERFPKGAVFLEPAFDAKKHLDSLLIEGDSAIALECKRLWMPTQVAWIGSDAERLSEKLATSLESRFVPAGPRSWYSMLLIEAWSPDHAAWWKSDPECRCTWTRPDFFQQYATGHLKVCDVASTDGVKYPLYWLYAYRVHALRGNALISTH